LTDNIKPGMEPKKNQPENKIPSGVSKVLNLVENIADLLFLVNDKGKLIYYSSNSNNHSEEKLFSVFKKFLDDKEIPEEGITEIFNTAEGKLKVRFAAIESGREKFVLGTGILIPVEKNNGLLWTSFRSKDKSFYSGITEFLTGYSSEELNSFSGRAFNLLSPDDAEDLKSRITFFITDPKKSSLELIYKLAAKSGKTIWLQENILAARNAAGEIICSESSVCELTRILEEKLVMEDSIKDLQNLNQSKDQFISVLSHDLKSPYTSILGFSEILLNESSLSETEKTEYLSYINNSSQSQLRLINNLLEWSRLLTGRKKTERKKSNLNNLLNRLISNSTRDIHQKQLEIRLKTDPYVFVEADETLLAMALNNLLSNAVKYSNPGKAIEIYVNRFRDTYIEVIVKDEGVGISEKNKSRIMKVDQVFSTPGTAGERGTGMGLLLSSEIIKSHSGEMWFYSEQGKGSEFHVTIPAAGNIVLIIDNAEAERFNIEHLITSSFPGFRVKAESNYYDALRTIENEYPAMIIANHMLPLMTGLEFLNKLKSEERFSSIPVIMYSPDSLAELNEKYKNYGVHALLPTPLDIEHLKEKIDQSLK
jgi:two-component system, sensor histidine kinase and response regulator